MIEPSQEAGEVEALKLWLGRLPAAVGGKMEASCWGMQAVFSIHCLCPGCESSHGAFRFLVPSPESHIQKSQCGHQRSEFLKLGEDSKGQI